MHGSSSATPPTRPPRCSKRNWPRNGTAARPGRPFPCRRQTTPTLSPSWTAGRPRIQRPSASASSSSGWPTGLIVSPPTRPPRRTWNGRRGPASGTSQARRWKARAWGRGQRGDVWGLVRVLWQAAKRPQPFVHDPSTLPVIGCDIARFGDDYTEMHVRWDGTSFHHERHGGWPTDRTVGRLIELCREYAAFATRHRPAHLPPVEAPGDSGSRGRRRRRRRGDGTAAEAKGCRSAP